MIALEATTLLRATTLAKGNQTHAAEQQVYAAFVAVGTRVLLRSLHFLNCLGHTKTFQHLHRTLDSNMLLKL
jgi:hypothetical protein